MTTILHGVVLQNRPLGEYDLQTTLFTKEIGRVDVLVKGARRVRSKLRGHLEVANDVEIMVAAGRRGWRLAGCRTVNSRMALRSSLQRLTIALALIEAVLFLQAPDEFDERVYTTLNEWLDYAAGVDVTRSPGKLRLQVQLAIWKLLAFAGYEPELFNSVRSRQPIQPADHLFSIRDGGLVASSERQTGDRPVSLTAVKVLRYVMRTNGLEMIAATSSLRIPAAVLSELHLLLSDFTSYTIERELHSLKLFG